MASICKAAGISCDVQSFREDSVVEPQVVEDALSGRTKYDLVSIVHSETSSGVINPILEVGKIVKELSPGELTVGEYLVGGFGLMVKLMIANLNMNSLVSWLNLNDLSTLT